jgi:hypothetical protein
MATRKTKKTTINKPQFTRPFETDYAGAWKGHCKSRESAILAAMLHVVRDGYSRATITNKETTEVVARVSLTPDRKRAMVDVINPFKVIGR